MIPLTEKQEQLLNHLRSCERCPSFAEMMDALGLKSKSGVHRLINSLEKRGFIRRAVNCARAIELVDNPHLPDALTAFTTRELAREARRRGLALGHMMRTREGVREFEPIEA